MLEDLAADFPLLASLVEQRAGGQKRLAFGGNGEPEGERSWVAASVIRQAENESQEQEAPSTETPPSEKSAEAKAEAARGERTGLQLPARGGNRRPAHYGLEIDFEERADDVEIGRLVDSTVWVNRAHPAYRRALASRSIGYHIALAVGMSLAPLAVEQAREHQFITAFLSRWGEALDKLGGRAQSKA
jgi:hypothetical protein